MGYSTVTGSSGPLSTATLTSLLDPPTGTVRTVIDTDTANEIDDHFALIYALLSDAINVEAIYAAPFHNKNSKDPADGMEKSYEAILDILDLTDRSPSDRFLHRGAKGFMSSQSLERQFPATEDLIRRASKTTDEILYVISIGSPTNIALAIENTPEIINNIVVVWLGGQPHSWHTAWEFNLSQDLHASKVLFDSGVPLVQIPCKNVAEHLRTTIPELQDYLKNEGPIADYLLDLFTGYDPTEYQYEDTPGDVWSKEIWDLAPVGYLINQEWVPTHLVHSPELSNEHNYTQNTSRHLMRLAQDVKRDFVYNDLFETVVSFET